MAAAAPLCVLAFDVGVKRVGIAVGNSVSQSARPLQVIERSHSEADWTRVLALVQEWRADVLVVGDPLTLAGEVQHITREARAFAAELQRRSARSTVLIDERSSSKEADRQFAVARASGQVKRKHSGLQDARAAAVILERWFAAGMPVRNAADPTTLLEPV